ncbi:hypothetical protein [Xanthobacter autotrophicus]|uniref:hypothetical protein n=1 Tax=Xanthobacter autotrophicus TaxID=280 RepID=UPI0024A73AA4|nr:hypothetical protein [Xanthobacter autotrophicus]MDI4658027.1 hypothetical protein [Xanthobacter autotrophicus]
MPVLAVRALSRNAFAGPAFTKPILRLLACCALLAAPAAARAEPVGVTVRNESVAATCAETDNVTLTFASDTVSRFRIVARHPAYAGMMRVDRTEPDFDTCDFSGDPAVPAAAPAATATAPKRITIYETPDLWLTGFIFPSFWRAATVPFRVGTEVTHGLHMVQLWVRGENQQPEEVLVVYPPDGYWRARPLSPAHLSSTAYGSSFLLGPVEQTERPLVRLKEIGFAPQTRTFTLSFADGGKARLKVAGVDRDALTLEAEFDGTAPRTFAALRSMYVTEGNADVARVSWRTLPKTGTPATIGEAPVLSFTDAGNVAMLWAGRLVPSRHNTSAPDYIFDGFASR